MYFPVRLKAAKKENSRLVAKLQGMASVPSGNYRVAVNIIYRCLYTCTCVFLRYIRACG